MTLSEAMLVQSALRLIVPAFAVFATANAFAEQVSGVPGDRETDRADPTGGAYTTPTLLFVPAGALPAWNAKVIAAFDVHGPTPADRLAIGTSLGFQPSLGGEIGLPGGFTLGAGSAWVGGDTSPTPMS